MKIEINEIKISFKEIKDKHPNLLASAALTLKGESPDYLVISGIMIWKSKIDGKYNVEPPKNKFFKYCYGTLWQKIRHEIASTYIPVIEEKSL